MLPTYDLHPDYMVCTSELTRAYVEIRALRQRTQDLYDNMSALFEESKEIIHTVAGYEMNATAKMEVLQPLENLCVTMDHIYDLLVTVVGNSYYKKVTDGYATLNESIVQDDSKGGIAITYYE